MARNIYKMGLHEVIIVETKNAHDTFIQYNVTRVPGGWLYKQIGTNNLVFVPYHNDLQIKESRKDG